MHDPEEVSPHVAGAQRENGDQVCLRCGVLLWSKANEWLDPNPFDPYDAGALLLGTNCKPINHRGAAKPSVTETEVPM